MEDPTSGNAPAGKFWQGKMTICNGRVRFCGEMVEIGMKLSIGVQH
jgi:hypothetical protein